MYVLCKDGNIGIFSDGVNRRGTWIEGIIS